MKPVVNINDYIDSVITEVKALPEFSKADYYGGEFDDADSKNTRIQLLNGYSNCLITSVSGSEISNNPTMDRSTWDNVFAAYILSYVDQDKNGHSKQSNKALQALIQLIKNNTFGLELQKNPKVLSWGLVSNQITKDRRIAKVALIWSQEMDLASSSFFNQ